ncbi:multiple epidermal growth factor-like domains protein 10 [Saccostrea echinata]|uniref:multiple epidermal growth factor-like domains protein 10 n=1 Tax=Saccostrea echinata TaxID=191078 RepID=UPI002A82D2AB|nr:multiple epidermal growth factor-like domains protein 10 [Saccostrea echinata]
MGFSACIPLIVYTWINILYHASCYNQLVRPGYTMAQSSSAAFEGHPNKTVDGDFRQSSYIHCMHTAVGHTEAWLMINLRKVYNINSVKFWYRNDSRIPGYNTRRIKRFSIRISNTTHTHHQNICYQDDGNTFLPPIIEKECKGAAQYVWIYTNKTFIDGAYLEICEVQVYGCSYQDSDGNCSLCNQCKNDCNIAGECDEMGCRLDGYVLPSCKKCKNGRYGHDCDFVCGHCASNAVCDHVTGSCPDRNCAPGWENTEDWKCDKACKEGMYGKDCSRPCGYCLNNATCNHVNGSCPKGYCEVGWKHTREKRCDQECEYGTFGYYCESVCSGHCAEGFPCNKVDGICREGCADGWINPHCNEKCNMGFYGKNCQEKCGHCRGTETCHHIKGSCPGLCEPGYQGENCKRECNMGFYGKNCQEKCAHCRGAETCHHIKGSCPGLCEPGYQGENCKRACNPGWYGRGCRDRCSHCGGNETCHHVNGSCLGLCQPGYQQEKCNEPCNAGWYGRECKERCGYCRGNKPCHHVTGSCLGLCEPGYSEEKCVFSQHLANQGKIIKLISELVAYKRRKAELRENGTSPTDFK